MSYVMNRLYYLFSGMFFVANIWCGNDIFSIILLLCVLLVLIADCIDDEIKNIK